MATATATKSATKSTTKSTTKSATQTVAKSATAATKRVVKTTKAQIADVPDAASIAHRIEIRLDEIQGNLPRIPAKWLELNRAVADRTISTNRRNLELLLSSVQTVAKTTDTGVRTVAGTIRWTVGQTVDAATTGVRRVTGQTKAQVKIAVDMLDEQVSDITDEVADRLDATIASTKAADTRDEKAHLNVKTKDELYEQAQLLEIDGRADMTKGQLVNAIAKAV